MWRPWAHERPEPCSKGSRAYRRVAPTLSLERPDGCGALNRFRRFRLPPGLPVKLGHIFETLRYIGMIRAEDLFPDRQRALVDQLRLHITALGGVQKP